MLTRKQHELLLYIDRFLVDHGVSPSFEEMKEALQLKSKSGIHRLIKALEERAFIRRLPNRARALEVLRMPEMAAAPPASPPVALVAGTATGPGAALNSGGLKPGGNVVQGAFGRGRLKAAEPTGTVEIPLHGKIAAGLPIEALEGQSRIAVPIDLIGRGDHFGLIVNGDSMVDMGILDGDTIIVKRTQTAENGDVVVALLDDAEATLKTFRRMGRQIELRPANSAYKPQVYESGRVQVQGRLVGLLRRY